MHCTQLDSVDSTNEYAKRLWRRDATGDVMCIVAREQTSGKGNHGRIWVSPRDAGVYMTVLQPAGAGALPNTTAYTLAAGIACAEILVRETGLAVQLKAINDLYLAGGKLGGILVETMIEEGRIGAVLTGVGVNWACAQRPLPGGAHAIALEDALSPESFEKLDRTALTNALAENIVRWNQRLAAEGELAIQANWREYALP